ncbi:hypothetical protein [Haloarchaeobius sp. DYHT-AS-18]|uniref:hypothetical protein n=1 Tax=Haloarchaeobius sp. DYHT-AS-18 TaxID=3446117 RepID=UPI003EBF5C78
MASSGGQIDREFDPSSDAQIRRFAKQFRALPEDKQRTVYEALSKRQKKGAKKAFAPTHVELVTQQADSGFTTAATETDREVTLKGYSTLGFHLWSWHHRVNWEYDGSTVSDVISNDYADVYDPTWSYDGTASDSLDEDYSEFEAFRQGGLSFIGGGYGFNATPYARVEGFADGGFNVISKSNGY